MTRSFFGALALMSFFGGVASAQPAPPALRLGPAEASVRLTVFCDIEAEPCERLMVLLRRLADSYPEKVGMTFRLQAAIGHKQAEAAYRAALAAAKQGKGWEFLDVACANRDRLDDAGLRSMAVQLQLDVDRLAADSAAGDVSDVLEGDRAAAKAQQVGVVPSVFVNGKRLDDAGTFDALDAAVKAAIK